MKLARLLLFVLLTSFMSVCALGEEGVTTPPYYRFWQGNQRKTWYNDPTNTKIFTPRDFIEKLNEWLIPATTSCCAKDSLLAYLPVVPRQKKPAGDLHIHDEYAIIVYRSEALYKQVRDTTNEGKVYGPLHGDVFEIGLSKTDPESSRSLVPSAFEGKIDLTNPDPTVTLKEVAYDVLGRPVNWQKGYSLFRVQLRTETDPGLYIKGLTSYLSQLRKESVTLGMNGEIVAIDEKKVIEYQNWASEEAYLNFLKAAPSKCDSATLYYTIAIKPKEKTDNEAFSDPLSYDKVDFGQGGNIQFTPGVKPGQVHHPLLNN